MWRKPSIHEQYEQEKASGRKERLVQPELLLTSSRVPSGMPHANDGPESSAEQREPKTKPIPEWKSLNQGASGE